MLVLWRSYKRKAAGNARAQKQSVYEIMAGAVSFQTYNSRPRSVLSTNLNLTYHQYFIAHPFCVILCCLSQKNPSDLWKNLQTNMRIKMYGQILIFISGSEMRLQAIKPFFWGFHLYGYSRFEVVVIALEYRYLV